ncbi:MAG: MFS transporter [Chloroflexi bacterium]|nr:MFS transporter [Chloroflexota bacterium]
MAVAEEKSIPAVSYGWVVLGAATFVMALGLGMLQSFGVFFKPIASEFQWTRDVTAVAYSIYGIAEAVVTPASGLLTDRYGPRVVLAASGAFAGLGYFLVAQTHSLWQFYLFFGLFIGLSNGLAYTPLVVTVNRWFHEKRGLAQGIVVSGVGVGTMAIPPLAAYLIGRLDSWRAAYVVLAAVLGIGITGAAFLLRRGPSETTDPPPARTATPLTTRTASLSLKQALRQRHFWLIFLVGAFSYGTLSLVLVHLVNYATDPVVGLSPEVAATLISVIGLASIGGKIGMGAISDYIGRKTTIIICCGLGGAMMFFLPMARSLWTLYVFAAMFGFAYGGWTPVIPALVAELFGLRSAGTIFGIVSLGGSLGASLGAWVGGAVFEASQSYVIAFILGAGVLTAAALLAVLIKEPHHGPRRGEA